MPGRLSRRPCQPRRARRGLSALTCVLLLSSVLAIVAASWQIDVARARIEGEVRHLGEVVAAEGYGLHHWWHKYQQEQQTPPPDSPCSVGQDAPCGRVLTSMEQTQLAGAATIAPWSRGAENPERVLLARGWEIEHLVANTGNGLSDGVIVLRPADDVVQRSTWQGTRAALDRVFGFDDDAAANAVATSVAQAISGFDFDPTTDRAVLASRFARIDTQAMLREPHAGHPVLPMAAGLDLSGNQIRNVEHLSTERAAHPSENEPLMINAQGGLLRVDSLSLREGMTIEGDVSAQTVTLLLSATAHIEGTATIDESLHVGIDSVTGLPLDNGTVTINGATLVEDGDSEAKLVACTDTEEDLCDGGDLNVPVIADAQTLDTVRVFGITTVGPLDTSDPLPPTSTITTTRARTGVFDGIEQPALTVTDCFRSVTPFVYGARC